ncbi:Pyridoxal-phosphate dependent enzyme superfamily [Synechococcus sp. PCC 7335]|uniref:threonine/serine dehydratase n=1 Tax=Synechococcus sp. (strain ATCC 29403 / PCC 7335) TaxID=91464 RepID=UPI00017EB15C|nr:threonine/serine dehydratase [Synechococcus sp. PCC 7335]EDX84529.1 Pyridoxal-phosphate dependent enzyme superfamily [Synechococcus sp. PCC 7335]
MKPEEFKPLIENVYSIISPYVRETPVIRSKTGSFGLDADLVLKLELFQHAGSFKTRGAFSKLLNSAVPLAGVIAASGGNHGAAVAYAAKKLGYPAEIFVPTVSSTTKVDRIRNYGAFLSIGGCDYFEALDKSYVRAAQTNALVIHAFDQWEVIAGQGTVGLEFEKQSPDLDTILVSVGGGGLIGGIAAWYQGHCKVVSIEPERAPTLHDSMAIGERAIVEVGGIAADALGARQVGQMMFPIAQQYVGECVLVDEDSIVKAQQLLWDQWRIVAEPAGVVPIAALISKRYVPQPGEKIGVLICGGNVNLSSFLEALGANVSRNSY